MSDDTGRKGLDRRRFCSSAEAPSAPARSCRDSSAVCPRRRRAAGGGAAAIAPGYTTSTWRPPTAGSPARGTAPTATRERRSTSPTRSPRPASAPTCSGSATSRACATPDVLAQKGHAQVSAPLLWFDEWIGLQPRDQDHADQPGAEGCGPTWWTATRSTGTASATRTPGSTACRRCRSRCPIGRDFTYYYQPRQPGTYMYHCHFEDVEHVQMGMTGASSPCGRSRTSGARPPARRSLALRVPTTATAATRLRPRVRVHPHRDVAVLALPGRPHPAARVAGLPRRRAGS